MIYLDYIFLENFILTLAVMYLISIFLKFNFKKQRVIIATILSSVYSIFQAIYVSSILSDIFIKILVVNIIIYIAFKPNTTYQYLRVFFAYFLIFFCYIGVVIALSIFLNINLSNFKLKLLIYLVSYFITYFILTKLWKLWKKSIKKEDLIYEIEFNYNSLKIGGDKKIVSIKGFVDTGNSLKDSARNLNVLIVKKSAILNFDKVKAKLEKVELSLNTINSISNMNGYIFKNVCFRNKAKIKFNIEKLIIVFVDEHFLCTNEYDALISYDTYIEKLIG